MDVQSEKRHVSNGPYPGERSSSGTDRLAFRSAQPAEVLARARAVLQVVLDHQAPWPTVDQWRTLLPKWFVQACAPEQTQEEAQRWLEHWRSLSQELKAEAEAHTAWSLLNWLYWFDPGGMGQDRGWYWWDAGLDEPYTGWIEIEIEGHPYPTGDLRWLLRACGGIPVD
jgi:hypothetical protein